MRVLVIGLQRYADSFAENLIAGLNDGGHDVRAVPVFRGFLGRSGPVGVRLQDELLALPSLSARAQHHVVEAAEEHRPELIINLDRRLSYPLVAQLRAASGAPVVFWFPDAPGNLGRETHVLAGYDALFLKDTTVVERYRRVLGLNAHFMPEACNPSWHRPEGELAPAQEPPLVVIAGNVYATRFLLLSNLLRSNIRLAIYGPPLAPWLPRSAVRAAHTGRYVVRLEKARAFRQATIVLNPLASHEADGLNCRLFEAAGCGAIVLTEWRDRLPALFDVPGEVHAFRTDTELVEQIQRLARLDLEQRQALSQAASARAHREHTYLHRFGSIVSVLGQS